MWPDGFSLLVRIRDGATIDELAAQAASSPEAVRRSLQALGRDIPMPLFDELDAHDVVLSECGIIWAEAARQAMKLHTQAMLKSESMARERRESLFIACMTKTVDKALRGLVPYKLKPRFIDLSDKEGLDQVMHPGGKVDAALSIYDESFLKRTRLEAVPLSNAFLALAYDPAHSEVKGRRLDIEDLYGQVLYLPPEGFSRRIDLLASDLEDFHSKISLLRTSYSTSLFKAVQEEGGFILVHPSQDLSSYGLRTAKVDWGYSATYGLVYSHKADERVMALVHALSQVASH